MFLELSEEESVVENDYKYFMSDKLEKSREKDALNRLQELEERERYLERRQRAREEQYAVQLDTLRQQIVETEKEIHQRQNKYKSIESGLLKKEQEIKDNIRILEEEHQKQVQEKIELKVPEFVESAVNALKEKETTFSEKAETWNLHGNISLGCSIVSAIGALVYGGFEFNSAAKDNIDWFFFSFLLLKGLIVVSLFGAFAKHAYNIGNAYMHESLKRSDRMHAINFGKLYLEVYGNDVSQNDMKSIFENWNPVGLFGESRYKISAFFDSLRNLLTSNFISSENGIAINGTEYNLHLSSKKLKVGLDVRTLVCFDAKLDKIKSKI